MSEGGGGTKVEENIHSIVFSVVYGVLLVVIIIHLLVHWQLRRRRLRTYSRHVPGDKSFKHKKLRETISSDFERIRGLTCNFQLIDPDVQPSLYGPKDDEVPSHWYRMKAFDISAEFVTYHISLVGHIHSSQQLILPQFLSLLQEKCLIDVEGTISQASSLYNSARHSLENFTSSHFELLKEHLDTLHNMLSRSTTDSRTPLVSLSTPHTPTTPQATPTTLWHERISARVSSEPLLEQDTTTHISIQQPKVTITPSSGTHERKGHHYHHHHRPVNLELTPLVGRGDTSPGYVISPYSHVPMPGTPV